MVERGALPRQSLARSFPIFERLDRRTRGLLLREPVRQCICVRLFELKREFRNDLRFAAGAHVKRRQVRPHVAVPVTHG